MNLKGKYKIVSIGIMCKNSRSKNRLNRLITNPTFSKSTKINIKKGKFPPPIKINFA